MLIVRNILTISNLIVRCISIRIVFNKLFVETFSKPSFINIFSAKRPLKGDAIKLASRKNNKRLTIRVTKNINPIVIVLTKDGIDAKNDNPDIYVFVKTNKKDQTKKNKKKLIIAGIIKYFHDQRFL